ncbi:MAG: hypothetical protein JSR98_03760 [Proteobacteria bacterium]|nr:hypothetical protein [Pseudomonadota bacterium]
MKPSVVPFVAALLIAGPVAAQAPPKAIAPAPADPAYAYAGESRFGVFTTTDGKQSFHETDEVPDRPGQQYGWFIKLNTNKQPPNNREEIRLPTPANS